MNYLLYLLFSIPGALIATTVHEFARAAVSTSLGDNLPKNQKRLTLNPVKHFEPIGLILLVYTGGFGWGRPVETSGLYYKDRRRGTILTAVLPSVANLILGLLLVAVLRILPSTNATATVRAFIEMACYYNVALGVFNILPVAPMDGTKLLAVLLPANRYYRYIQNEKNIQMMFLLLLFFGLFGNLFRGVTYGVMSIFEHLLFFL